MFAFIHHFLIISQNFYRADDYNDPIHLERISTLNMFETRDLGAIPTGKVFNVLTTSFKLKVGRILLYIGMIC